MRSGPLEKTRRSGAHRLAFRGVLQDCSQNDLQGGEDTSPGIGEALVRVSRRNLIKQPALVIAETQLRSLSPLPLQKR